MAQSLVLLWCYGVAAVFIFYADILQMPRTGVPDIDDLRLSIRLVALFALAVTWPISVPVLTLTRKR